MSVPKKPRPRPEKQASGAGTAIALLGLLIATGLLIGLGTMVMPQVFGLIGVVFGFICFGCLHYLLWGWWLRAIPPEDDDEDA